ncbi:oligosaccharide flippase family protein [Flammeovirga sp. SJP92]|uniref:oligosaccharide flippase family protein n=1 Tax=Flammeovirga sp. SJP92 TaxID=1775430 RepID=UPI0007871BA3|nr:oligosaccharide flippase family protein [Flammeovirga sp. SJP92]KXX72545.1 hypothetical protein AVL50_00300 [Flammeovirga sp. SJP92]
MSKVFSNIKSGVVWSFLQIFASKFSTIIGQLLLAYILNPEDFGKVSIATSIIYIISLFQNIGISDILISRGKYFSIYTQSARSISLVTGFICLTVTLICGKVSEFIYHDQDVSNFIYLSCISIFFNTLSNIPESELKKQLKFKKLSILKSIENLSTQIFIVLFAYIGFKSYSFIYSSIIISIFHFFYIHKIAKYSYFFEIKFKYWKSLIHNSIWGLIFNITQTLIRQVDYLILGVFSTQKAVGLYFMAYTLSTQTISLVINIINPILFPIFKSSSQLTTKERNNNIIELSEVFSFIGFTFSISQVYILPPIIDLFLEEKWFNSIEITQILLWGMGFKIASTLWTLIYKVNSDFIKLGKVSLISSIIFTLIITFSSYKFGNIGTAYGVSFYNVISSYVFLYVAFSNNNITSKKILFSITRDFLQCSFFFIVVNYVIRYFNFDNKYVIILLNITTTLVVLFSFTLTYKKNIIVTKIKNRIKNKIK